MMLEEWQYQRKLCLAQMAATLESGDRSLGADGWVGEPGFYADRAMKLFDAVEATIEGKYDEIHPLDR